MSEAARFSYAQVRLQARHGERADEHLWRRLQGTSDLASYLQTARQTSLRPWVTGIQGTHSSHEIELMLRRQYRGYVDQVAHWLPARWVSTVQSLRRVPDLPALQHLMTGEATAAWMLEDPELRPLSSENQDMRLEAMQNPDLAWLVQGWQREQALYITWLDYWRSKWPVATRLTDGLEYLARLVQQHILTQPGESIATGERRDALMQKLVAAFRRYSFQPAAACAHLGLIALDLEKLRGDLVGRLLFPETAGAAT
jgi:hypothetical protein